MNGGKAGDGVNEPNQVVKGSLMRLHTFARTRKAIYIYM